MTGWRLRAIYAILVAIWFATRPMYGLSTALLTVTPNTDPIYVDWLQQTLHGHANAQMMHKGLQWVAGGALFGAAILAYTKRYIAISLVVFGAVAVNHLSYWIFEPQAMEVIRLSVLMPAD